MVTGVSEVTPDKWEVVEDHGKDEITLITCVSVKDNSKRYVVAGDLVGTKAKNIKKVNSLRVDLLLLMLRNNRIF